jgi:hypothetical protein
LTRRGEPKNIRHAQTRLAAELKHLDRMRSRIGLPPVEPQWPSADRLKGWEAE